MHFFLTILFINWRAYFSLMNLKKLNFATPGIPLSTLPRDTINGIEQVKKLGLDAMELEFVHSVNVSKEKAPEVKKIAEKNEITLTCHASFFVNLNAKEPQKRGASRGRIISSAKRLDECGGYSVCFHPAFYLGMEPKKVYATVKEQMTKLMEQVNSLGLKVWIRPETTGKATQFGSIEELCDLSAEFDQVLPVVDFSHLHSRSAGKFNTKEEFDYVLGLIEKKCGKEAIKNMHIHLSGINYSDKGERNHLIFKEADMNYKGVLQSLKDFNAKGVLVCESPNVEEDTLLLKKTFEKL